MQKYRDFTDLCSDTFKDYFFNCMAGKHKRTVDEYISYINLLCNGTGKDFVDISEADAQRYFNVLRAKLSDGKLTRKTFSVRLSCYRTVASYIEERESTYRNVFAKIIRPEVSAEFDPNKIPSLEEMDSLFSSIGDDRQMYLIVALASRVGLSTTSILNMTSKSVFEENGKVYLHFEPKSDFKKDSFIQLPDDVAGLMQNYLKVTPLRDSSDRIFKNSKGNPMTLKNVDTAVKKYVKKSGLDDYTLKDFRNRAILEMAHHGASIQSLSDYTGLQPLRLDSFIKSKDLVSGNCPAELVNYRLIVK